MKATTPEVRAHLAYLALLGRASTTVYSRHLALDALAAAIASPVIDATPAMLTAWRANLHHAPATICCYISHVSQFYAWAVREELRRDNPAARLAIPRKPRRLPRPIATADLVTAYLAAQGRVRAWILLAAFAGLRCCEIAGLRAECVILRGSAPRILVAAGATKGTSERSVPLCGFAAAELAVIGLPSRGWCFGRLDGQPGPNRPWTVSHVLSAFLHDLGLPDTPHSLRHWFGSEAYDGSGDIVAVMELLGHKDISTTRLYVRLHNRAATAAVATLPVPPELRRAA
jgi:integrase